MSRHCDHGSSAATLHLAGYRRVLWIVLSVNAVMFAVEIGAGFVGKSAALQADALDFFGDAVSYGISLAVAGMALRYRALAALLKGTSMSVFGVWVISLAGWQLAHGTLPHAETMGIIGAAALVANIVCTALLWSYRRGDSNMRSVWLCSRNDAIGNLAVILAAFGVFGTQQGWPDAAVAAIMAVLALQGGWLTVKHARTELRGSP